MEKKLSEEQIKAMAGTMLDGPNMTYNGWQEFAKIKGAWKSADGAFELQCREAGEATFIARGKAALDVRLNLMSRMGMGMGMMIGMDNLHAPAAHEIVFVFQFAYRVLDAEATPLYRLGNAWYDADTLTISLTDLRTNAALEIPMVRQTAQPDLTAPIPRFCPECGSPMEGKRVCGSCGWIAGSN